LSLDGKGVPFVQLQKIGANGHRQNICEVGDLSVKLPCCLYNVQQDAKPAASYSRISHISGAMFPVNAYPDQVCRVAQHMGNKGSCYIFCRTFVDTWIIDMKLSRNICLVTGRSPCFNVL
jgi:hypothetical protein